MEAKVIATTLTSNNVIIFLHEDGAVSTRLRFTTGGKLPVTTMLENFSKLAAYTDEEIPGFIRSVRAGKTPAPPRPSAEESEAIMASNAAARVEEVRQGIVYDRSIEWRA